MSINLRESYAQVIWDLSSKRLDISSWGKENDTGRGIVVTIAQNRALVTPTLETLRMSFTKPDGTNGYIPATLENDKYYIENMSQVFAVVGTVEAELEIVVNGEFVKSATFYIPVLDSQISDTIISSNDYSALQEAVRSIEDVKSQLAETMNKTAVTLTNIFADNTARDAYFTANPTKKVEQLFIKVGIGYQQYLSGTWTAASPVLIEMFNQIDDASTGLNKTLSAKKELELLGLKVDKTQEAWIMPTLLNGWMEYTPSTIGNVKFKKDQLNRVSLFGGLSVGVANTGAFLLPAGYRPGKDVTFIVATGGNAVGKITIGSAGNVVVSYYSTVAYLHGISFIAEG